MRIRCIKPEFWADEQIASWPPVSRLAYIALWNEADDEGRLRASPAYLLSRLFPYDPKADMVAILRPIIASGKLRLYEISGERFALLPNFRRHQVINKPTASKLPAPPTSTPIAGQLPEDSRSDTVVLQGGLEQGTGNRERDSGAAAPPALESAITAAAIYDAYPRKVDRKDALRAITKAMGRKSAAYLFERCQAYAEAVKGIELQFIPYPATWFNADRFDDTPDAWNPQGKRFVPAPKPIASTPRPTRWRERIAEHYPDALILQDAREWEQIPTASQRDVIDALSRIDANKQRRA